MLEILRMGLVFALPCVGNVSRIISLSRYIPYAYGNKKGDDVTAIVEFSWQKTVISVFALDGNS
jgi:hypothetical protein